MSTKLVIINLSNIRILLDVVLLPLSTAAEYLPFPSTLVAKTVTLMLADEGQEDIGASNV